MANDDRPDLSGWSDAELHRAKVRYDYLANGAEDRTRREQQAAAQRGDIVADEQQTRITHGRRTKN